jgi:ABC-type polysaccharide/polyol phosphate export permease
VLLAIKPWAPAFTQIFTTIYQRANMIASGKMFLANSLPSFMLAMFDWNPLFHVIDQARGYAFINYNPRYSNWEYAVWVGVVLMVIGLMGEFYTRKHASASWSARR